MLPEGSPQLSLIVASYNRAGPLQQLLQTLSKQTLNPSNWEMIVVVDGSMDNTLTMLTTIAPTLPFKLNFFYQDNAGPAAARHLGIEKAASPYIAVLDDDMEPCPGFLAAHLAALTRFEAATVVLGKIIPPPDFRSRPLFDALGEYYMQRLHEQFERQERQPSGNAFATGNVAFPKALYFTVGGFDRSFRLDEDRELGIRFELAKARFSYSAEAAAIHHSNIGAYQVWLQRHYNYGLSSLKVWAKHGHRSDLDPIVQLRAAAWPKRQVILLSCRSNLLTHMLQLGLRGFAVVFRNCGSFSIAITCYKLVASTQFYLGVKQGLGSWKSFKDGYNRLSKPASVK